MRILKKKGELSHEKFDYLLHGPQVGGAERQVVRVRSSGGSVPTCSCQGTQPSSAHPPPCIPSSDLGPVGGQRAAQPSPRLAAPVVLAVCAGSQGDPRLPRPARGPGQQQQALARVAGDGAPRGRAAAGCAAGWRTAGAAEQGEARRPCTCWCALACACSKAPANLPPTPPRLPPDCPSPGDWKRMPEFDRLLLFHALRPDRLTAAMAKFVAATLGKEYVTSQPYNLERSFQVGGGGEGGCPAANMQCSPERGNAKSSQPRILLPRRALHRLPPPCRTPAPTPPSLCSCPRAWTWRAAWRRWAASWASLRRTENTLACRWARARCAQGGEGIKGGAGGEWQAGKGRASWEEQQRIHCRGEWRCLPPTHLPCPAHMFRPPRRRASR